MQWQSVISSNLSAVAYEAPTLYVRFKTGATYAYDGVPANVHAGLMSASSHGSYLASHVKGRYPYRKL